MLMCARCAVTIVSLYSRSSRLHTTHPSQITPNKANPASSFEGSVRQSSQRGNGDLCTQCMHSMSLHADDLVAGSHYMNTYAPTHKMDTHGPQTGRCTRPRLPSLPRTLLLAKKRETEAQSGRQAASSSAARGGYSRRLPSHVGIHLVWPLDLFNFFFIFLIGPEALLNPTSTTHIPPPPLFHMIYQSLQETPPNMQQGFGGGQ